MSWPSSGSVPDVDIDANRFYVGFRERDSGSFRLKLMDPLLAHKFGPPEDRLLRGQRLTGQSIGCGLKVTFVTRTPDPATG
jgi:hypothetical protein